MILRVRTIAASACICSAMPAFAHHPGGAGNTGAAGPINTQSATTLDQGAGVMGVSVSYSRFNTLSDPALVNATAAGIDDVHGLTTIQSYALTGAHGVTHDLLLSFYLPYVKRTGVRAAEDDGAGNIEVEDHGISGGVGDLQVAAQYRFFNDTVTQTEAAVILGLRAPTGRTGKLTREGEVFDPEFQPGAGSWGGIFGAALTKRSGPWSFDTSVIYELATKGAQNSDLGDQVLYNAAVSYRLPQLEPGPMFHGAGHRVQEGRQRATHHHPDVAQAGPAIDLVLELNGLWHDQQVTNGEVNENSGGHTLFLAPGLRVSQGRYSSYVSFGIPIADHVNGLQADADWRISSGISVRY